MTSWLIRCWEEPQAAQEAPVYRCYIRDLRTGEEHYLNDPRRVGELVLRQLRPERSGSPAVSSENEIEQRA